METFYLKVNEKAWVTLDFNAALKRGDTLSEATRLYMRDFAGDVPAENMIVAQVFKGRKLELLIYGRIPGCWVLQACVETVQGECHGFPLEVRIQEDRIEEKVFASRGVDIVPVVEVTKEEETVRRIWLTNG